MLKRSTDEFLFVQLCAAGKLQPEDIHDWIDVWHETPAKASSVDLPEYLGMTKEEYQMWVLDESYLERIIDRARLEMIASKKD